MVFVLCTRGTGCRVGKRPKLGVWGVSRGSTGLKASGKKLVAMGSMNNGSTWDDRVGAGTR